MIKEYKDAELVNTNYLYDEHETDSYVRCDSCLLAIKDNDKRVNIVIDYIPEGHWIPTDDDESLSDYVKCSQCGGTVCTIDAGNFCSYCGADMRRKGR